MKKNCLLILMLAAFCGTFPADACMIPVYRYGLEAWIPDNYQILVFYKSPLSKNDEQLVKLLDELKMSGHANYTVQLVDISAIPEDLRGLWKNSASPELPLLVLMQPPHSRKYTGSVWSGKLTEPNIRNIVDSPARREIADRLLGGDALVWIFLESGDKVKDEAASKLLSGELSVINKELKVSPELVKVAEICNLDLNYHFSSIKVSRNDPAEKVFIDMLLHSEPDLAEVKSEPMAFPVFVRGRVITSFVGKGIKDKFIMDICKFSIDACGCEIKADNPGIDLLVSAGWDARLGKRWVDAETPLTAAVPKGNKSEKIVMADTQAVDTAPAPVSNDKKTPAASGKILRNVIIAASAFFIFIIVMAIFTKTKSYRSERRK